MQTHDLKGGQYHLFAESSLVGKTGAIWPKFNQCTLTLFLSVVALHGGNVVYAEINKFVVTQLL